MTSSDDKMFRRCSKALRWLSSNSIDVIYINVTGFPDLLA